MISVFALQFVDVEIKMKVLNTYVVIHFGDTTYTLTLRTVTIQEFIESFQIM